MDKRFTHRMSKTRIYHIWQSMKIRCNCSTFPHYKDYGGRGIKVCDKWNNNFENFQNDMLTSYKEHFKEFGKNTFIERINNNGNYCLENCKWATRKEQANNRRSNRIITYKGQTMNLTQWAKKLNMPFTLLLQRLNRYNWSVEKTFITPVKNYNITFNGQTLNLTKWSKKLNISVNTLATRLNRLNWSVKRAFTEPIDIRHRHKS